MDRGRTGAVAGAAIAAGLALLLTGCTPAASVPALERTVPALGRPATPADALPAAIVGTYGFDPQTARHVASRDDVEIYLAEKTSEAPDVLCLILYREHGKWGSVCGAGDRFGLTVGEPDVSAVFIRHGVTPGDVEPGWTQVSENVVVQD